jgi:hypothetical protein
MIRSPSVFQKKLRGHSIVGFERLFHDVGNLREVASKEENNCGEMKPFLKDLPGQRANSYPD